MAALAGGEEPSEGAILERAVSSTAQHGGLRAGPRNPACLWLLGRLGLHPGRAEWERALSGRMSPHKVLSAILSRARVGLLMFKKHFQPWLVQLSGLSTGLQTKGSQA